MDVNAILAAATPSSESAAASVTETVPVVETAVETAATETTETETKTETEVEAKTETEPTVEETPELKAATERLRQAALRKQAERTTRQNIERQAQAAIAEATTLKQENAAIKQRLAALEAFERDPLEYLEKHNGDPVSFLQNAHRIALNGPATRAERMAEEATRRVEALEKRPAPQEVVDSRLQAAAYSDATASLVAESESGAYPLFASKDPEHRVAIATREAKALVKSGNKNFGYAELCTKIEESLLKDLERANEVLAATKSRQQKTPPATTTERPKTVTQHVAAADSIAVSKMTQEERDAAADRLIEASFF